MSNQLALYPDSPENLEGEQDPPGLIVDIRRRRIYPGVKLTEKECETIWADIKRSVARAE